MQVSGHTQTIALIGSPVEHSLSPAMHTQSFNELGVDCVYLAYDIEPQDLESAAVGMKKMGFAGYNVTMPHKTFIPKYLDELSDAAELMGAVNTVAIKDKFFDVTAERVAKVAEQTGCKMRRIDLEDKESLKQSIAESALFVNATRVGMGDLADQSVILPDYLVDGIAVADTVYEPRKTKLLKDAEAKGLKAISGLGMLLWQAAIAEDIWVGKEMPTKFIEEEFFN